MRAITAFRLVTAGAERLAAFYEAIGLTILGRAAIPPAEMALLGITGSGERLSLQLGESRLDLDRFEVGGAPYPAGTDAADQGFQHFALRSLDAAADWQRALAAGATPISRDGAVLLPPETGGVIAAKLRDPEGHPLEFLQFPVPKSPGIDHSAISVSAVEASLAFYQNHGLTLGKATRNHGPTQQRLDGLDGVEVDVLPLLPAAPDPHLELLAYRLPHPKPAHWQPHDIAATRLVWTADRGELLRDPDGHLHQLVP